MKTDSPRRSRKAGFALVLVLAAGLRLWRIGFGLPALNDPDEPLFVMTALDMLRGHSLDPQWFGHPATVLFYLLDLVLLAVGAIGRMLGQWHGAKGFVAAVFADPGVVILPMRLTMAACGVGCVALTERLGTRIGGARVGLVAALLLACNPLHIAISQLIRTDVLASLFMLWSSLRALDLAEGAGWRAAVMAGVAAGLATATKWPAVLVLANVPGAVLAGRLPRWAVIVPPLVAGAVLLTVSPYLLLDHATVLADLHGETRPGHLGSTGFGFGGNLWWYLVGPLAGSFGVVGLAAAALGAGVFVRRHARAAAAILPGAVVFLLAMAAQALVWERWIVPVLPAVALLAALGIEAAVQALPARWRWPVTGAVALALAAAMIGDALAAARMRTHDTAQQASGWVLAHVAPRCSVLIEHAGFDLMRRPGPLLFPLGSAGCVDVRQMLAQRPSYHHVEHLRTGRAIVDIGNVDPARLGTCRADIAILSHYSRYRAEAAQYPVQLAVYAALMAHGQTVARFAPVPGRSAGREIQVVTLSRAAHACLR